MSAGSEAPGLSLRLWGVGGSAPAARGARARWGGETVCFELRAGPGAVPLVVDLGSGARDLGAALAAEAEAAGRPPEVEVVLTHFHFDHVMGLPFFAPLYVPGARVTLRCGIVADGAALRDVLERLAGPPWFPVEPLEMGAPRYLAFDPAAPFEAAGLVLRPIRLTHPGGCVGVRAETADGAVCIVGDHEHGDAEVDAALEAAVAGADVMIYDGAYDAESHSRHLGWGHSTWEKGVELARAAGVGRTLIHHHLPQLNDDDLDARDAAIRAALPSASLARQGAVLRLENGVLSEG